MQAKRASEWVKFGQNQLIIKTNVSISLAKSSWLARKFWVNTKNQLNSLRSFNWSLSFVPDISEMSKSPWLLGHPSLHDVACCACAFWWSTFPPQENVCEWKLYSPPPSFVLYSSIYPYLPERHLPKSGSKENEAHQCRCDIFFSWNALRHIFAIQAVVTWRWKRWEKH